MIRFARKTRFHVYKYISDTLFVRCSTTSLLSNLPDTQELTVHGGYGAKSMHSGATTTTTAAGG